MLPTASGSLHIDASPTELPRFYAWWYAETDTVGVSFTCNLFTMYAHMTPDQFRQLANEFNVQSLQVDLERDEHLSQRTQPMETAK